MVKVSSVAFSCGILVLPFSLATKKDVPTVVNDDDASSSGNRNGTATSPNDNTGNGTILSSKQKRPSTAKKCKQNKNKIATIKSKSQQQPVTKKDNKGEECQTRKTTTPPTKNGNSDRTQHGSSICFVVPCCILHVVLLFLLSAPDNYVIQHGPDHL